MASPTFPTFPKPASTRPLPQPTPPEPDLSTQLITALAQVNRLDADFNAFRQTASRRLAAALEENKHLRLRLAALTAQPHPIPSTPKPSEKMLSVAQLRATSPQPPVIPAPPPSIPIQPRRSLRPLHNRRNAQPHRSSFVPRRTTDPKDRPVAPPLDKENVQPPDVADDGRAQRRSVRLSRSFSRKLSACF